MAGEWRIERAVRIDAGERWPLYRLELTDGADEAELVAEIDVRGERIDAGFCANEGPALDWLRSDEGFYAALAAVEV